MSDVLVDYRVETKNTALYPRTWIIIPNFNGCSITQSCLGHLIRQTYPNIQIVLVDSGSTDGTVEFVAEKFPDVAIVRGNPQWWWTKATNEGVKFALSRCSADDYIMTLNNDVVVPNTYLAEMVRLGHQYKDSIIGSVIYDAADTNRLVECGSYIDWRTMKYEFLSLDDFDQNGSCERLRFLCGKGVLYPMEIFRNHGLFDEAALPHYGADQDFIASCRKWGYQIRVQTRVPLYSHEDITAAGARDVSTLIKKLNLLFMRKSKLNLRVHMEMMFRHCPRRYWATSAALLTCRLLGHIFLNNGIQRGPQKVEISRNKTNRYSAKR
jgi:GT2 family glycosyltransferase